MKSKQIRHSRHVPGLTYTLPFEVGDVVYFKDHINFPMIVKEIGVPIEIESTISKVKDHDGHIRHIREYSGNCVEGVRVKHSDGFAYVPGFEENLKIANLKKYTQNQLKQLNRVIA